MVLGSGNSALDIGLEVGSCLRGNEVLGSRV